MNPGGKGGGGESSYESKVPRNGLRGGRNTIKMENWEGKEKWKKLMGPILGGRYRPGSGSICSTNEKTHGHNLRKEK